MDVKYGYEVGDMVKFTLTPFNSPKLYTGVIVERYGAANLQVYRVSCLEKGMNIYSVSEVLIIERISGERKRGRTKI